MVPSPQVLLQTVSGGNCHSLEVFLETNLRLNGALKELKLGLVSPNLYIWASAAVTKPEDLIWVKLQGSLQAFAIALFRPVSAHFQLPPSRKKLGRRAVS